MPGEPRLPGAGRRLLTGRIDAAMIAATSEWVQALAEEFGLTHEDLYRVDLCLSELVTNVVSYADPDFAGLPLEVRAAVDERSATLTLIDAAQPFDPLSRPPPPVAQTIGEMQVGGQGIHLVRNFSDACRYERSGERNRLELVFNRGAAEAAPSGAAGRAESVLSPLQMFRGVSGEALEDLADRFPIQTFAAETLVLERGDPNRHLLAVLAGGLRVSLDPPGSGETIEIGVGECVGEMSIIDEVPASAYVVATEGTRLLLIDARSFLDELMPIPGVARNLMSALAGRMRRSDAQLIQRVRHEVEMEQAQRELDYARSIQLSLLPQAPILADEARLRCVGRMCTAREVGGDFYDIFRLDDRHVFFVIADVCGKGLPAALFMVRAMAVLRAQTVSREAPAAYVEQVAARLNAQLCEYNEARQFLTAFCAIVDLQTLRMHYVNAGHNPPVLALGDGAFGYLAEPINPIVGMVEGLEYRAGEVQLGPQSVLLLYTDGVTEAEDTAGDMLGEDRLLACLDTRPDRNVDDLVEAVFSEVTRFAADAPQSDDITVLAIQFQQSVARCSADRTASSAP